MKGNSLAERVSRFQSLELPGQPLSTHMGTAYLVRDLWAEVKRLRAEQSNAADNKQIVATCGKCGLEHRSHMSAAKCCR